MATLGSLTVEIGGDTSGLKKAEGEVKKSTGRMESAFSSLGGVIAGAISVEAARRIVMTADKMARLESQVKRLTRTTGDFSEVWSQVASISNENGTAIEDTTALFQRFQKSLGGIVDTNQDVLNFIDTLQKVGTLGGASAMEMSNALTQLSQGLSGGIIRAEEWNSVIEQAPEILNVVAKNIEGVNGDLGALRKIMLDGELTADKFYTALMKGAVDVEEEFSKLPRTVEQAWQTLTNQFSLLAGGINEATEGTKTLAGLIDDLSGSLENATFFWRSLNKESEAGITSRMSEISDQIKELEEDSKNAETATGRLKNALTFGSSDIDLNKKKVEQLRVEYKKLQDQLILMRFGVTPEGEIEPDTEPKKPKKVTQPKKEDEKANKKIEREKEAAQDMLNAIYLANLNQKERLSALETEQLDILMENYLKGYISYEQYQTAMVQTGEDFAKQRAEIEKENTEAIQESYNALAASIGDTLGGALAGTRSWSDAMRSIISDLASQFITAGITSAFGGSVGGGNLFSGLFGAGRAMGGPTSGMLAHPVNERGVPEVYSQNGQQYLLPTGGNGRIDPLQPNQSGGMPPVSIISMGEPQQVSGTQMSNGEFQVMIDDAISRYDKSLNSQLASGRGKVSKSLQGGFKVQRNLGVG